MLEICDDLKGNRVLRLRCPRSSQQSFQLLLERQALVFERPDGPRGRDTASAGYEMKCLAHITRDPRVVFAIDVARLGDSTGMLEV